MNSLNPDLEHLKVWFQKQCIPVMNQGQRVVCVLSGKKSWALALLHKLTPDNKAYQYLIVSSNIPDAISHEKSRSLLGNEYDVIVFDAHDRFAPDSLGAVSGTLRGGGIFFLLIPDINAWPALQSARFLQRVLPLLKNDPAVYFIEEGKPLPVARDVKISSVKKQQCSNPFLTYDQQHVVSVIEKNMLSLQPVPIVIISDRGRGKSSSLGFAAARLLQQGINNIIVTAPRLTTSEPLFKHAQQLLPGAVKDKGELRYQQGLIRFIAPDALLDEKPGADVLMVDEAAAIPLPMLEKMLQQYSSVVFSSTIHGYEGTGRGFTLKFNKVLDVFDPGWLLLKMTTPIRWAEDDPMERWVDRLLCLDAELADVPCIDEIKLDQCKVALINRDEIVKSEDKLSSLFALLVVAHYRTQPSDLQYMLDDPHVRVYSLEYQQQVIGAVLINQEGGFDEELSTEIYQGIRRPSGHLLAQTLTFHAGCEDAATLRYARVMRIAIHPQLQGQGFGSYLLAEVVKQEEQQDADAIGTSFGSTPELLRFWQRAGFELVRIGFTRDHASGTHSAVMLKAYTDEGKRLLNDVQQRFQRGLPDWLSGPLSDLPGTMKNYLDGITQMSAAGLNDADWQDINSFTSSHRGYEACMAAIKRLLESHSDALGQLTESEQQLVDTRVIQGLSWGETVKITGLSGKSQALQQLREAIEKIVNKVN